MSEYTVKKYITCFGFVIPGSMGFAKPFGVEKLHGFILELFRDLQAICFTNRTQRIIAIWF